MLTNSMPFLLGMDTEELRSAVTSEGYPAFRGNQLSDWIYRGHAREFSQMSNIPATSIQKLILKYGIGRSTIITRQNSLDGTIKLLLEYSDGARLETVGLPFLDRYSCCVSTQSGCPIGCSFCASGHAGLNRSLSAGEIVDQVLTMAEISGGSIKKQNRLVDHVTFMGMGEPLLNYEATVKALRLLRSEMGISLRNVTISTIGHVPGIRQLSQEGLPVTLAISLHAPTDEIRRRLIPGFTRWSVKEIVTAGSAYTSETGRRLTFEYCMLKDINDGIAEASQLAGILKGLNCHVNLIPFNPVDSSSYSPSPPQTVERFASTLRANGILVTKRIRRGIDIDAACGQLKQRQD